MYTNIHTQRDRHANRLMQRRIDMHRQREKERERQIDRHED